MHYLKRTEDLKVGSRGFLVTNATVMIIHLYSFPQLEHTKLADRFEGSDMIH